MLQMTSNGRRAKGRPSDEITRVRTAMEHGLGVFMQIAKEKSSEILRDYDGNEMTMLHIAVALEDDYKRVSIVRHLLSNGSNVNACATFKDEDSDLFICGRTPLHIAAIYGYADVIRPLLERGADHLAKDSTGNTAVDLADQFDNYGCLIALLHHHVTSKQPQASFPSKCDRDEDLLTVILERNRPNMGPPKTLSSDSILDKSISEWLNTSEVVSMKIGDDKNCKIYELHDDFADVTLIEERHSGLEDTTLLDDFESSLCNRTIRPGSSISFSSQDSSMATANNSIASTVDATHVSQAESLHDLNRRVKFGYELWLHCPKSIPQSDRAFYKNYIQHQEDVGVGEMPLSYANDGTDSRLLPGYPDEINDFIHKNNFCFIIGKDLEEKLIECSAGLTGERNRFIYLLLDPNVCGDLPTLVAREPNNYEQHFAQFIKSVFYVGRGQVERQYAHLYEAASIRNSPSSFSKRRSSLSGLEMEDPNETSSIHRGLKVERIQNLWKDGGGVLSLHCFRQVTPSEAITREALMVEALDRANLTNSHPTHYKISDIGSLNLTDRRLLGSYLLWRAFRTLLMEGSKLVKKYHV